MRPVSHQLMTMMPVVLALVLILLAAAPLDGGALSFTPNVAWLMTLVMVVHYPPAWPRGVAFALGLLQDILFGTPLGSQALLALLLAQLTMLQSQRQQMQLFRLRWMEVAGALVLWHGLLWAVMQLVTPHAAPLRHMIGTAVVNALWYPIFYGVMTRMFAALPDAR